LVIDQWMASSAKCRSADVAALAVEGVGAVGGDVGQVAGAVGGGQAGAAPGGVGVAEQLLVADDQARRPAVAVDR
jgi:hypothetical protein